MGQPNSRPRVVRARSFGFRTRGPYCAGDGSAAAGDDASKAAITNAAKLTNNKKTLEKISKGKAVLERGQWAIFIGAMLSLDYYFSAIRPQNFVFVALSLIYFTVINRAYFHTKGPKPQFTEEQSLQLIEGRWAQPFSLFTGVISIIIPWLFIFSSPKKYLETLAPALYLAMAQSAIEAGGGRLLRWAPPIQLLAPVAFTTYRLLSLRDWVSTVCFSSFVLGHGWGRADRFLALGNIAAAAAALFVFAPAAIARSCHPRYRTDLSPDDLQREGEELLAAAAARRKAAAAAAGGPAAAASEPAGGPSPAS